MSEVLDRIDAWQSTGLIDSATADRLRATERASAPRPPRATGTAATDAAATDAVRADAGETRGTATAVGSAFGPAPTVAEVFSYLGIGFLIAAWTTFVGRLADGPSANAELASGAGLLAVAMVVIAAVLRSGDARRRRGAGVAVLVATAYAAAAAYAIQLAIGGYDIGQPVFEAVVALAVAVLGRILVPSLTTQAAVLATATWLGSTLLQVVLAPATACCAYPPPPDDVARSVILPAVGWLAMALGIGVLALFEDRTPGDPARRRAALSRFWAGLVAIGGVAMSLLHDSVLADGTYGRLIEPWMADLAILLVAVVLVERALRRDSTAYLAAAAIGFVTALTDFNLHYLGDTPELALLVEGGILLAAGVVADRLRRRIDRTRDRREPPSGSPEMTPGQPVTPGQLETPGRLEMPGQLDA
jgi:hypothetical protein